MITTATPQLRKLRASGAFLEAQARRPEDVLALVEVARPGYIPPGLFLRETLTPTQFTALIPNGQLDAVLADDGVVLVQPTSGVLPASCEGKI